ncbi:MAG: twin-arginine translocase subunit TatC [Lentisphaeria bacterium]|jgi:sec-independent protein translocase protein TatC|nr:twin-arginine translocase subunit TatC [Lentisphaeria bacterium]
MEDEKLSIIDHLEELRVRLLTCMVVVALLFPLGYWLSQPAIDWLLATFTPPNLKLHTFAMHEWFFLRMKLGFGMAVFAAFPVVAWQVWRFVAPGLYEHERHYMSRFVFVSTFLFVLGAAFALFAVYPLVLRFFIGMQMESERVEGTWGVANFVGMGTILMLGFGFMFQLPVVVYLLAVTEIVSLETMRRARPVIVVVVFLLSAILTPPDVVSQLMMAIPAMLLFEISLLVSQRSVTRRVAERRRIEEEERRIEAEEERQARVEEAARRAAGFTDEEQPGETAPVAAPQDEYTEYYDEFYHESQRYADVQPQAAKPKPDRWQVRGLRRDRRFMSQALRKRPPRRRK